MAGQLVLPAGSTTPVWDVAGDGSEGYIEAVASIPLGSGRLVYIGGGEVAWDIAGDGSQGYIKPVASINQGSGVLRQIQGSGMSAWDVAGDGSEGFIKPVAIIPAGNGKLVMNGAELAWDVTGDGSFGYIRPVAVVASGGGALVKLFPGSSPVWDVAGDGSQNYIEPIVGITGSLPVIRPTISAVSGNSTHTATAYLSGRQFTTITGTGFTGTTSVKFGDQDAEWFEVISYTQINCLMFCVDHAQLVDITVTTPNGSATFPFAFIAANIDGTFNLVTAVAAPNMDGGQNSLGPELRVYATTNPGQLASVGTDLSLRYYSLNTASNTAGGAQCCGPDGNTWSVDSARKSMWKTTPGGVSTEYPLTVGTYDYWAVVVDPNGTGNLWVVASNVGRTDLTLFKVTQTGTVTIYGPFTNQAMLGAVIGPDLRLWGIRDGVNVYAADLSTSPPTVTGYVMDITDNVYNVCVGNDTRIWASDNFGRYYAFDVADPENGDNYDTILTVDFIQQSCAGPDGQIYGISGQDPTAVVLVSNGMDGTQVALSPLNLSYGDVYSYLLLTAGADGALYSPGAAVTLGTFAKFSAGTPIVYLTDENGNYLADEDGNLIEMD